MTNENNALITLILQLSVFNFMKDYLCLMSLISWVKQRLGLLYKTIIINL